MHNQKLPSFLLTESTGAPPDDVLDVICPFSRSSSSWDFSSLSSTRVIQYGALEMGVVYRAKLIQKSTSLFLPEKHLETRALLRYSLLMVQLLLSQHITWITLAPTSQELVPLVWKLG